MHFWGSLILKQLFLQGQKHLWLKYNKTFLFYKNMKVEYGKFAKNLLIIFCLVTIKNILTKKSFEIT